MFGISSITGSALTSLIGWIFESLRAIILYITGGLITLLNYAVYARAYNNVPIVVSTWGILRDLSNMFFILALIYMAFATIFNVGKYRFQDMIYRFLIVAVLINFSLVIGGLVIDGCQILTNVFLHSIGNPGDKLGQFLNPSQLLGGTPDAAGTVGPGIIGLIFMVILGGIYMFSLLVAVTFSFFRIFAIWGLLIVSPIAWMAYILPGTKKYWSKWWSWFFGWNLFLPLYLFIFYIGLLFLSQGTQVVQRVIGSGNTALFGTSGTGAITINLIFFYTFATFFISYGTLMAAKLTTSLGASGFEGGLNWARTTIGKLTGYDARRKMASEAVSERVKQFQTEGFQNKYLNKIYGGKQGDERFKARVAERLGVHDVKSDQLNKDVGIWKDHFKNMNADQLRAQMNTGPEYRQLAARELLRGMDQLSNDELIGTYEIYKKEGSPAAAKKFLLDLDYEKMDKGRRKDIYDRTDNLEVKHKIANVMADKGDFRITENTDKPDPTTASGLEEDPLTGKPKQVTNIEATKEELKKQTLAIYKTDGDRMDFLKKMHKKNFISAARAAAEMQAAEQVSTMTDSQGKQIRNKAAAYKKYIEDKVTYSPTKELADLGVEAWTDDAFLSAVKEKARKLQDAKKANPKAKGNARFGGGDDFVRNLRQAVINGDADSTKLKKISELGYGASAGTDDSLPDETGNPVDQEDEESEEEESDENDNGEKGERADEGGPRRYEGEISPDIGREENTSGGPAPTTGLAAPRRIGRGSGNFQGRQPGFAPPKPPEDNNGGTPPTGGTVSYREIPGINQANVVDLRNKKDVEIK